MCRDVHRCECAAACARVRRATGCALGGVQARGPDGFSSEVVDAMTATSTRLSKARKARVVPPELAPPSLLASYTLQASQPLHKTGKVPPSPPRPAPRPIPAQRAAQPLRCTATLPQY